MQSGSHGADESASLQSRLEDAGQEAPDGAEAAPVQEPAIGDPVALLRHLDVSGHFHRDGRSGRLFHAGMVSLRENVADNSLHVVVDDNRIGAHVDRVSPLAAGSRGASRYSVRQAVAHNVAGMAQDLGWLLRGRQGDHRCELNCVWDSSAPGGPGANDLLDPKAAAWSVQLEARVAGSLDEARLRAALSAVLGGHVLRRDPLDVVDCHDDDALDAARARLLSMVVAVGDSPPLHVYLARHPGGDVLMLNLNHAAADGFGALRVLQCIARAYASDVEPGARLDFLAASDLPIRPAGAPPSLLARAQRRAVEKLRDVLAGPAPLAADEPADRPGCGLLRVGLSAEETGHVVDVQHAHTSTNVLMGALHLAIGHWNMQHGAPHRRIGVLVQANLRPAEWRENTIGNISVVVRLSTSRRDRSGPGSVLEAVSALSARNKRTRTGIALIAGLQRAGLLALWAKQSIVVLQPLTGNRLVDTTMLCHLGSLDEAPSFGPDAGDTTELWFSTPARSPLSLCLGAVTVGGRLQLTFRYPHRLFGADAARRFAGIYLDCLRLVAAHTTA